jgi:hypothetical protein
MIVMVVSWVVRRGGGTKRIHMETKRQGEAGMLILPSLRLSVSM